VTLLTDVISLAHDLGSGPGPVLLDIRWRLGGPPGLASYRSGHVPGAVFVDLDRDLSGPPGAGGRHPLPSAARFQAAMRRAGVQHGRDVVVYDEADATAAARGWWLLRYSGHDRVRVLDGGYRAWVAAGQPVATGDEHAAPGDFAARPGGLPLLDAAGAAWLARHGLLLDARAAERYRGDTEPVDPVAGHIPGAVSAPAIASLGPDGRFLPPDRLRARFAALAAQAGMASGPEAGIGPVPAAWVAPPPEAGVAPPPEAGTAGPAASPGTPARVGVYCGSGVTAAHEVLALALVGQTAALYAGSWSHWITDPGRPVATGPAPG
jgi:thiosulfate/3-mercaptopyruvate sulfurtransferase